SWNPSTWRGVSSPRRRRSSIRGETTRDSLRVTVAIEGDSFETKPDVTGPGKRSDTSSGREVLLPFHSTHGPVPKVRENLGTCLRGCVAAPGPVRREWLSGGVDEGGGGIADHSQRNRPPTPARRSAGRTAETRPWGRSPETPLRHRDRIRPT